MKDYYYLSFGGGVNSVAALIYIIKNKLPLDAIIFADTGSEKPETYEYIERVIASVHAKLFVTVRYETKDGETPTLYEQCINYKALPSIAYGFKSCSDKFKRRPIEKYIKSVTTKDTIIHKYIGFDAGEERRVRYDFDDAMHQSHYPLFTAGIDREGCIALIESEDVAVPPKSACFFCPSSKKYEVIKLSQQNPALFNKAVEMERNATLTSIKGLGRNYSWEALVMSDKSKDDVFVDTVEIPCECLE